MGTIASLSSITTCDLAESRADSSERLEEAGMSYYGSKHLENGASNLSLPHEWASEGVSECSEAREQCGASSGVSGATNEYTDEQLAQYLRPDNGLI